MSLSYVPAGPGDEARAEQKGFVVEREFIRVSTNKTPDSKKWIKKPSTIEVIGINDVIEDHVQVINPELRHFVAIICPLAAGLEPLNPNLLTAPPDRGPPLSSF